MFSNPPHNLAAAALNTATLHNAATLHLISRSILVSKNALLPSAAAFIWRNSVR